MVIKCNFSFIFKGLRKWTISSFQVMLYFFVQIDGKLNIRMQSVTNVIV